jgi:hypothetical protein
MAIEYQITVEDDLLRVTASGRDDSLEEVQSYGMAVVQAAIENRCSRVVCDETNLVYTLGTIDTFRYGAFIATKAPRLARVALVINPDQSKDAAFWETVVINRGLQVRIFDDAQAAEAWVRE